MNGTSIAAGLGGGSGLAFLYNGVLAGPLGLVEMPVEVAAVFVAAGIAALGWLGARLDARASAAGSAAGSAAAAGAAAATAADPG